MSEWNPKPDEWYIATARHQWGSHWFSDLSNGEQVFVHSKVVPIRDDGHNCLQAGQQIGVRIEKAVKGTEWVALEAVPEVPAKYPATLSGVLTRWNNATSTGFASLPCGCSVYVIAPYGDQNQYDIGDAVMTGGLRHNRGGRTYFTVQNKNQSRDEKVYEEE